MKLKNKSVKSTKSVKSGKASVAKSKPVTPKASVPAPFSPGKASVMACIGERGVVLCAGTLSRDGSMFRPLRDHNGKATSAIVGAMPAIGESVTLAWKGKGDASAYGKAIGAYVSASGGKVKVLPVTLALSRGLIRKAAGKLNGKSLTCYVPKGWTSAQALPQYIGAETPQGRFEPFAHPAGESRQGGAYAKGLTIK